MKKLYLFTNTKGDGYTGWENCYSMDDQGTVLGNHLCSDIRYMYGDLVSRGDRKEKLEAHFGGKEGEVWEVVRLAPGELPPKEVLDLNEKRGAEAALPDDERAGVTLTFEDDNGKEFTVKRP